MTDNSPKSPESARVNPWTARVSDLGNKLRIFRDLSRDIGESGRLSLGAIANEVDAAIENLIAERDQARRVIAELRNIADEADGAQWAVWEIDGDEILEALAEAERRAGGVSNG